MTRRRKYKIACALGGRVVKQMPKVNSNIITLHSIPDDVTALFRRSHEIRTPFKSNFGTYSE